MRNPRQSSTLMVSLISYNKSFINNKTISCSYQGKNNNHYNTIFILIVFNLKVAYQLKHCKAKSIFYFIQFESFEFIFEFCVRCVFVVCFTEVVLVLLMLLGSYWVRRNILMISLFCIKEINTPLPPPAVLASRDWNVSLIIYNNNITRRNGNFYTCWEQRKNIPFYHFDIGL